MLRTVEVPLWLLVLIVLFATVTFASHFLFPSVRWFLRRRAERLVEELNKRLERPIQPFKLARRTDMIQRLSYDPSVMEAVAEHARETGVREDVAFEQAQRYAREIVPGFSASAYFGFATRAARWLSTRLYHVEVWHEDPDALKAFDPNATVVYIINHRSNMDYVLVTYLVARQSALAYAVGEWARIWPLGPLIRALGGYFIRRRYRTALYRRVLARYVQMASKGGVAQAVFPEGGLSQTGRLKSPKVGILSYITEEFDLKARDLVFVPIGLNYDRVIEDNILIEAHEKGQQRFRGTIPSATAFSARYIWRRLRRRAQRFGRAGVSFGTPLSMREFEGRGPDALAAEMMTRIAKVMPVVPVPLVAMLLHEAGGQATRADLLEKVGARMAAFETAGAALLLPEGGAEETLEAALQSLTVRKIVLEEGGTLRVAPEKQALLSFYAASLEETAAQLLPGSAAVRKTIET
ncbi:1-acyl-sn-glycerol-3-phosphate acyltransferase [Ovoidimarina sediminis]|uniref:1-acyl-sn-glycerol-3-phosphate acyltransferase n=1 Tax=Ovoidimarina sediminis TaxID=3079856 RepID=UPI00290EA54E|nr:1-acyl-sn-glycerol-3-phosphate acyltransferase [Rhodophyticola sp. MJ-SS7]MDU8944583.1 1-acyl-sn-glycerol-3-phosphate acyltransferase [Rhodophyticola sp. MJ-SS7]